MEVEAHQYKKEISRALDKVLSHSLFKAARRSSSFLRYVCEKTMAGEDHKIKEFSIAVDAFGLEMTFDQQIDPRIRVEAKRLRDRLKQYYDGPGSKDPVTISLEKGSYIPCFYLSEDIDHKGQKRLTEQEKLSPVKQSIILDKRFLIHLDVTPVSEDEGRGTGLFINQLIQELFKMGQNDYRNYSVKELETLQNEAFPLILTISHHIVSDIIHFILRLKLHKLGTLIRSKEICLSIDELTQEELVKITVLQEAEEILSFCRSIKS